MCGVGKFMKRWGERDTDACPRCGATEDAAHVWICKHSEADSIIISDGIYIQDCFVAPQLFHLSESRAVEQCIVSIHHATVTDMCRHAKVVLVEMVPVSQHNNAIGEPRSSIPESKQKCSHSFTEAHTRAPSNTHTHPTAQVYCQVTTFKDPILFIHKITLIILVFLTLLFHTLIKRLHRLHPLQGPHWQYWSAVSSALFTPYIRHLRTLYHVVLSFQKPQQDMLSKSL
jgi:hypothetical protein